MDAALDVKTEDLDHELRRVNQLLAKMNMDDETTTELINELHLEAFLRCLCNSRRIVEVHQKVVEFAGLRKAEGEDSWEKYVGLYCSLPPCTHEPAYDKSVSYLTYMLAAITDGINNVFPLFPTDYDRRFMYWDHLPSKGYPRLHPSCGIVRHLAAKYWFQAKSNLYSHGSWARAIGGPLNPFHLRFSVEYAVFHALASGSMSDLDGTLPLRAKQRNRHEYNDQTPTFVMPQLDLARSSANIVDIYVPTTFYQAGTDCILALYHPKSKHKPNRSVTVVGVKITPSTRDTHKYSESIFFSQWDKVLESLKSSQDAGIVEVIPAFLWILANTSDEKREEKIPKKMARGKVLWPGFERHVCSIGDIDGVLHNALIGGLEHLKAS